MLIGILLVMESLFQLDIKNLMDRKEIQEAHEKYYPEYDAKFKDMKIDKLW